MDLIASFSIALLVSTLLVPFFIRHAPALRLIDVPTEERKVHGHAIPRSGGLGIAIGFFVTALLVLDASKELLTLLAALAVIAGFGLVDDRRNLSFRWKFLGQGVAALILISGGVVIERVPFCGMEPMPLWFSAPLTLLFIVGVTNAVNLTDGLDGLAAGNCLLSLVLIAVLSLQAQQVEFAILALAAVGALLGFLRFNTHPAIVFMGDTGSQFLGFLTVSLAILATQGETAPYSPLLPLLIAGLPVLDTCMVMGIRLYQGRFIFSPDRNHIHHQLLALRFHHHEVVAVLYLLATLLAVLAYSLRYAADSLLLAGYVLFCGVLLGGLWWARMRQWQCRQPWPEGIPRERRRSWTRRLGWYHHHAGVLLEGVLCALLLMASLLLAPVNPESPGFRALALAVLCVAAFVLRHRAAVLTRFLFYTSASVLLYVSEFSLEVAPRLNLLVDGLLMLTAFALVLAVRVSRRSDFRFDTHDYLLVLLLLMVPFFLEPLFDRGDLTRLLLRFVVLAYTCEFVLARDPLAGRWLRPTCFLAVIALGLPAFLCDT